MSFHQEKLVLSTSSGTGQVRSNHSLRGLFWQIIIEPASSATKFDFQLLDSSNQEVLGWEEEFGSTNSGFGLEIPAKGYYTFKILNSSADEVFNIRFTVKEPVYG